MTEFLIGMQVLSISWRHNILNLNQLLKSRNCPSTGLWKA